VLAAGREAVGPGERVEGEPVVDAGGAATAAAHGGAGGAGRTTGAGAATGAGPAARQPVSAPATVPATRRPASSGRGERTIAIGIGPGGRRPDPPAG